MPKCRPCPQAVARRPDAALRERLAAGARAAAARLPTFEVLDEKGRPRQFGSVAGGGRYDDLVKRFTGQSVPATGVSIGVDRLLAALRA